MKHSSFACRRCWNSASGWRLVAKQNFAEAEAARARGERLLQELQEVRAALLDELRVCQGQFDPLEMRVYQDYMQTITQSIREQENYVAADHYPAGSVQNTHGRCRTEPPGAGHAQRAR